MSDGERTQVYKSLAAFATVLIVQTVSVAWWAATLQANVANHERQLASISPRVELLERDYYRRGGENK